MKYKKRSQILLKRNELLNKYSDAESQLIRTLGSPAQKALLEVLKDMMTDIGLEVRQDHIGNLRGRLTSYNSDAKYMVIGGHVDTVKNGGKFDGTINILIGLSLVEKLLWDNIDVAFHIEIVAFVDGANTYFEVPYLGCKSLLGMFNSQWLNQENEMEQSLKSVLETYGEPSEIINNTLTPQNWLCYFQVCIDHTDTLDKEMTSVGTADAINGFLHLKFTLHNTQNIDNQYPVNHANQLVYVFSIFISKIEDYANKRKEWIYVKIHNISIDQKTPNQQIDKIRFELNIYSKDNKLVTIAYESLRNMFLKASKPYDTRLEIETLSSRKAVPLNSKLTKLLSKSIEDAGYEDKKVNSFKNQVLSVIAPFVPTCMLFVRSIKGLHQHKDEHVRLEDIMVVLKVADNFLKKIM